MKKIAADRNYRIIKEADIIAADGNLDPHAVRDNFAAVQQNITSLWDRINWLEQKLLTVLPQSEVDTIP